MSEPSSNTNRKTLFDFGITYDTREIPFRVFGESIEREWNKKIKAYRDGKQCEGSSILSLRPIHEAFLYYNSTWTRKLATISKRLSAKRVQDSTANAFALHDPEQLPREHLQGAIK